MHLRLGTTALIGLILTPITSAQEFRSFVGANNTLWESPSNWNPNLVPDSISEGARLDNGATVQVGGSHTIFALEIKSGALSINQSNTLRTGNLLIDATSTISGPGTLIMDQSGTISSTGGVSFANVTFRNEGTLNIGNSISLNGDAVYQNVNTTEFADGSSVLVGGGAGAPGYFENTGFLRKSFGTGTVTISPPIDNDLEIASLSGLMILGSSLDNSGQLRTGPNATLRLSNLNFFSDGASIFGDGVTELRTGTLEVPTGATASFDNFSLLGGQLIGDGVIEYEGPDNIWSSGSPGGTLTSKVMPGATLTLERTGNGPSVIGTHGIEITAGGKLLFPADNSLLQSNGVTTLLNHGVVEFAGDGDLTQNGPDPSTLMNFTNPVGGSVVKTSGVGSANPTAFVAAVTSAGSWQILGGKMIFFRAVDFSGPMEVSTGAEAQFSGGSLTPSILRSGAGFNGGGTIQLNTIMEFESAAVVSADRMELQSGSLVGDGTLRVLEDGNWKGGSLGESFKLRIASGANFHVDGSGSRTFASGSTPSIINDGNFELTGTAQLRSDGAATFANNGTLLLSETSSFGTNAGVRTILTSSGSLVKEAGTVASNSAISNVQVDLEHSGTMDIRSGIMNLQGNHLLSAPIQIDNGAVLRMDGSTTATFLPGSSIIGDGTFEQRSTTVHIPSGASVPISNYTTPSGIGQVTGTGTLVIATDTVLDRIDHQDEGMTEIPAGVSIMAGGNRFRISGGRTLHVAGNMTLTGNFNSTANDGARIENDGVMEFENTCSIGHGGGIFSIRNDGIIRCNAPGSLNISLPPDEFSGDGRMEITSGKLTLTRPVALTGTTEVAAGAQLSGNSLSFAPGSFVGGNGTISGPMTISGTAQPGMSIGTLNINNNATFTSSGVLAVELGNGTNDKLIVSGTLDLGGLAIDPQLVSGYMPIPGTTWDIVTAGSFTGSVGLVSQSSAVPGFGFFLSTVGNQLRLTYSAIDSFQKAYEAATGLTLGPNPDLGAIAEGDIDNDGRADLLDWVFGGTLSGPDPGRELIIDSVASIAGNMRRSSLRYPINPLATDVNLSWETNTGLDSPFSSVSFTPTSTATYGGILFQEGTVDTPEAPKARFFKLRAELP